MNVRIKFLQKFTDGNIFQDSMKMFQEIEVPEATYQRVLQSGGEVELLGKVVPPSTVKKEKTKVTKRDTKGQFVKVDLPDPEDVKGEVLDDVIVFDEADEKTITPDKVDD